MDYGMLNDCPELKERFLNDAKKIATSGICHNVKGCSKTDMATELRWQGWKGMRGHEVADYLEQNGFTVKRHGNTGGGYFETIHWDGPAPVDNEPLKEPEEKLSIVKAKIPATRIECSNEAVMPKPRPKLKLAVAPERKPEPKREFTEKQKRLQALWRAGKIGCVNDCSMAGMERCCADCVDGSNYFDCD